MSEIAAKLAERRGRIAAMQRHESDSDDDDDSGWDDSHHRRPGRPRHRQVRRVGRQVRRVSTIDTGVS